MYYGIFESTLDLRGINVVLQQYFFCKDAVP